VFFLSRTSIRFYHILTDKTLSNSILVDNPRSTVFWFKAGQPARLPLVVISYVDDLWQRCIGFVCNDVMIATGSLVTIDDCSELGYPFVGD
jgi:hypothetical protein